MTSGDRSRAVAASVSRWLPALAGLFVVALVTAAVLAGIEPPRARPATARPQDFSAVRARSVLARLLGNARPRPVGSDENRAFRTRLERELRALGIEPRVERGRGCRADGVCADVENVVATLPGRRGGAALVLAAHYDSVGTGPGAADDGAGVAAMLEVARALRAAPALRSPVLLLFSDGEEAGMLGAELFVQDRARLRDVAVVVNLEARGVRGPSLMFETSTPNLELVRAFARSAEHAVTSSLFYAAYEALPNDTDLSVFRREGLPGYNFAFIGGAEHYHRATDDLAHLSLDSLQHHGDQALALIRELSRADLKPSRDNAVFFDVAGRGVVVVGVATARALTALFAALALGLVTLALGRRWVSLPALAAALLAWLGSIALALLGGMVADAALRPFGILQSPWPRSFGLLLAALHGFALAAVAGAAALVGHSLEARSALVTQAAALLAVATLLAARAPEALYAFLVPGAATTLLAGAAVVLRRPGLLSSAAVGALAINTVLWAPLAAIGADAFGVAAPALTAAAGVIVLLPLLPLVAGLTRRVRAAMACIALAASAFATFAAGWLA